jgi:PAS domain S-box-containing protein
MSESSFAAQPAEAQSLPFQTAQTPESLQTRIDELERQLQDCRKQLDGANALIHRQQQEAETLRKREECSRLALDLTRIASWDWNLITGEVSWNDNHFYLLGYRVHEVLPSYEIWYEHVHPEDREWVEQRFIHAIETRSVYEVEYRVIHPDGSLHWLFDKGLAVYNEANQAIRMIGITMDISERKRAEAALRRSEEQHRLTLELTHIGCWLWDLRTDEVIWNDNHFRLLGYQIGKAEVDYQMWRDRVHPEDVGQVEALQSHALANHTDYTAEYRVIHPDGNLHWMMSRGRGVYDASGQARQMVGVIIDISDRKWAEVALQRLNQELESRVEERTAQLEAVNQQLQNKIIAHEQAEDALRRSEERLRLALEAAHMGVWEVNLTTGEQIWSTESEQLFGFAPGTFDGTQAAFLSRLHPEDQDRLADMIEQATQTGHFETEYRVVHPDKSLHWIAARGKVFLDEAGNPTRMSGVDLDISDRKQAENQIRSALNEKEVLLKEIHHRVKNNLQIISSLLRMQARQAEQQTATLFQEAQNRVRSMALIHEQLYQSPDLSHINFGRYVRVLVNQLFQCYGVGQNTVALTIEAEELPLSLNTAIPCGLIVNELVSNALKYAFPNDRHGSITIQLEVIQPDQNHSSIATGILTVTDDGIGIPPEVDWQTSSSLGLRIVRNLITQLNGNLTINHCCGTKFHITFPVHAPISTNI